MHEQLTRLLGPGPAALYLDAHRLLAEQTPYICTTHLVFHLFREIESSLRRVLLPYNYPAPAACSKCGYKPEEEGHKKQIEAIAKQYHLDTLLSNTWIALATGSSNDRGFAAFAHRDALTIPRPRDTVFDQMITEFERVLTGVLETFEQQSLHVFALLNELLSKSQPGKKDVISFKNKIPANWATYSYFFSRLENPAWLQPLMQKDGFALPPMDVEDGRLYYARWPQAEYLQKMAVQESKQEQVLAILETVANTDNPFARRAILEIGTLLPAQLAVRIIPALKQWFSTPEPLSFISPVLETFITHLVEGGEALTGLELLEASLTTLETRNALSERWEYEQILLQMLPLFTRTCPREFLQVLCRLLEQEVYQNYIRYRDLDETDASVQDRAREASTTSWQRTIEASGNPFVQGMTVPLHLFVLAIRTAMVQAIEESICSLTDVVSLIERFPGRIFRRLTLYLLSSFASEQPNLVRQWLMARPLFEDRDSRHEYMLLAKAGLPLLSQEEQNTLLQWIEKEFDLEIYRQNYLLYYQKSPTEEDIQKARAYAQRNWFGELADVLPEVWQPLYENLVNEYGPYNPEPELGTWSIAMRGPTIAIEEYRNMPVEQLLLEIGSIDDKQNSPRAGLVQLLTTLIAENPEQFANQVDHFQEQPSEVVQAALQGFIQALQDKETFDCSHLLPLCAWTIDQRIPPMWEKENHPAYQPEWAKAGFRVAHLLLLAFTPSAFPLSSREELWSVLEPLTVDPHDLLIKNTEDTPQRYYAAAINSTRGVALQAVMEYARWLRKQWEEGHSSQQEEIWNLKAVPEVQEVLERCLALNEDSSVIEHAIFGQYFPLLVWLDSQWATEHLMNIFPRQPEFQILYQASWETYLFQASLTKEAFILLKDEYSAAIDHLSRNDTKRISIETPEYHLVSHLMQLYASSILSIDTSDDLLAHFFHNASDELRHSAFAQIGQSLARNRTHNEKQIDPQIIERFQLLWEWRISEIRQSTSPHNSQRELAAFGWWIQNDVFPPLWSLQQLAHVLTLETRIDMSSFVVNRLAAIADQEPELSLQCLNKLVPANTNSWGSKEWNTSVASILNVALQQENEAIRMQAKSLISSLALRGHTMYLALLAEAN